MLWIPTGFAHGFSVLSEDAQVLYKATDFYHPESERTVIWDDARLGIDWRLKSKAIVSGKDQLGVAFEDAETF
jgi:dTDP-4-dehydrorhamnose 3,5-epimerase